MRTRFSLLLVGLMSCWLCLSAPLPITGGMGSPLNPIATL